MYNVPQALWLLYWNSLFMSGFATLAIGLFAVSPSRIQHSTNVCCAVRYELPRFIEVVLSRFLCSQLISEHHLKIADMGMGQDENLEKTQTLLKNV